ncbi:type II toxin-antitoxin system prevent-host-death family antitoxin [Chitinimonas koreensis]|uniref:type II toxin-antitoxin system prevent-host-death family antitoxin n=1 Tax=Chitinimonas koreensis TaxID=356302 RepID=UPI00040BBFF9|nr:type II toxin-antitoxin system prevent-host-death family antitoxin [Chitinimonas koreensis]QNM95421.1 type II toxin-antitoxin system prevent-host-death family antitoxin [Chitinimonas koreensis]
METILANRSVGLSELKANPAAVMRAAETEPVAILNRNKPAGYVIGTAAWEAIAERLDNLALAELAAARLADGQAPVKVTLDEL